MMISIATIFPRCAADAGARVRRRLRAQSLAHAKSPCLSAFLPCESDAQCEVERACLRTKISDSLQMRNHSRFLNPIEKRLTGAQYFAIQEWHDAVRRECTRETRNPGERQRKVFSAFAIQARRQRRSAG